MKKSFDDIVRANSPALQEITGGTVTSSASSSYPIVPGHEFDVFLSSRGKDGERSASNLYQALVDVGVRTFRDDIEEIGPDLKRAIQQSMICIPIFTEDYVSSKRYLVELAQMVEWLKESGGKRTILPLFLGVVPREVSRETCVSARRILKGYSSETVKEVTRVVDVALDKAESRDRQGSEGHRRLDASSELQPLASLRPMVSERQRLTPMKFPVSGSRPQARLAGTYLYDGAPSEELFNLIFNFRSEELGGSSRLDASFEGWDRARRKPTIPESGHSEKMDLAEGSETLGAPSEKLDLNSIFRPNDIIRKIIPDVLKGRLGARQIVGMDDHEEVVMDLLEVDAPAVRTIGIAGMGGIGKSTIAMYVYKRINKKFDYSCCFIDEDAGESLKVEGMTSMRRLISDDRDINSGHRFQNKKVLVLLDDVDREKIGELRNLVIDLEKCGQGSRAIVTTRDKSILDESGVEKIYEVPEMHEHNAFTLFCKHAFGQDSLPTADQRVDWVQLSWQIVTATGRLPLAIETMGSYLACKSEATWLNALTDLKTKQTIQHKLKASLEISYNALSNEQQQVFLDIGCIFIGMDKQIPVHAWRARGFSPDSLDSLHVRSLIKIRDDGTLWVHDDLRNLCMDIVRRNSQHKLGMQSRLWCNEDVIKVLSSGKATPTIEAIHMNSEAQIKAKCFSGNNLKKLSNLWYLGLVDAALVGNFKGCLPNLKWLGWQGGNLLHMPPSLHLEKLVVLDLSKTKVTKDWSGWSIIKSAVYLKVLNLTSCHQLTETPEFGAFIHLKRLILEDCIGLTKVHQSIGRLIFLESLNLKNCQSLKNLPLEFECLHYLTELVVDGSSIRSIPISSGMKKLEILSARSCKSLAEVPECIGELESLRKLSLSDTILDNLPDSVGELRNLEELNIDNCSIGMFPRCIGRLEKLEVLNASRCLNMTGDVPPEVGNLKSLRVLRLDHTSITSIPATLAGLSHLDTLDLEWCVRLQRIPDLPGSLVNLKLTRHASSVGVPNLAELIKLKQLQLVKYNNPVVLAEPRDTGPSPSASSPVPLIPGYEYEIFLSFRGPDTRGTFTDFLYEDLKDVGIRVFKDDEDLRRGEEFGPEILRAIEHSKIFMPIISKGYASSKWCLREVAHVIRKYDEGKKPQQQVLPIFYDIAPNEVRDLDGTFEEAFSKHAKEYDHGTVKEWREALGRIGKMGGWDLTNPSNMKQGQAIKDMVSEALNRLKKPFLDVTENLVGMEEQAEQVMKLLDFSVSDVRMVGICGMSGIGKTTVAKFIYNQVADQFQFCCYLDNIRDTSRQHKGLESLQAWLASSTLRRHDRVFSSVDEGISVLQDRLKCKKSLILLDDIDEIGQLNALARDLNWFGKGSRIIVTTPDRGVLEKHGVKSIHNVTELQELDAFRLFCKHAFRQNSPVPHLAELAWKISQATGRIPLVIVATGSALSFRTNNDNRNTEAWLETLDSLVNVSDVRDKLRISYEALRPDQQEVFLDIACLFIGTDKRIPIHTWKAQRYPAITILQDLHLRSLIKIRDDNTLWMHDCQRDLAREIVREKASFELSKHSRLWCSEDAMEVLRHKKGTTEVKAICLDHGMESEPSEPLSSLLFINLSNIWFLELGNLNLTGDSDPCLLSLKWLSWHGQNPLNIPRGFLLNDLIILDLSRSWISEEWRGWDIVKVASKLEVLNLTGCHQLKRTPDLSSFKQMKKLYIKDCTKLAKMDQSIGCLQALELLDMRNCKNLKELPEELGHLKSLTELLVDETGIQEIPISGDMSKLEILSARLSRSLIRVPAAIGKLNSLKELSLSHTGVIDLPDDIGMLNKLVVLNIDHCAIRSLPLSLNKLEKLEELNASGCLNLTGEIPDLERLQSLRILRLDQTRVTRIPESISKLPLLQTLGLKDCRRLQSLPEFPPSLVDLTVRCTSSVMIANFPTLINLKQLEVQICGEHSQVLKAIDTFSNIEKLSIAVLGAATHPAPESEQPTSNQEKHPGAATTIYRLERSMSLENKQPKHTEGSSEQRAWSWLKSCYPFC